MADPANDTFELSDGSVLSLPHGMDENAIKTAIGKSEDNLAAYYSKQAAAQNSPVTPLKPDGTQGDLIYSASTHYPNKGVGPLFAHLDHWVPGVNTLNSYVNQSAPGQAVNATVFNPLGRAESHAVVWPYELGSAIYNTAKHYTPLGTAYDAPDVSGAIRSVATVPEMDPNAPLWQRGAESALTSWMSPGVGAANAPGFWSSLAGGYGGTALSDLGGKIAGEGGSLLGAIIGSLVGNPTAKVAAKLTAPSLRDPTAESTWTSAEQARPQTPRGNFAGLTLPALGDRDWSQFTPGFISLANPIAQRIAGALRSIPVAGKPIEEGVSDTSDFIRAGKNAAAAELAGQRGIPPDAGPATIGPVLTSGAQDAITQLYRQQNAAWNAQHARMSTPTGPPGSAEVKVPNTVLTGINEVANERRGDTETAATNAAVKELTDTTPGLGTKTTRFGANQPPLPAQPTTTWSRLNDWVRGLTKTLDQGGSGMPSDIADALKKVANSERERAAEAAQPGSGGRIFRILNENYAKYADLKDQLAKLAGKNLGGTGRFINVPGEQTASSHVTGKMQSPSDPIMEAIQNPAFPAEARMNVAGQIASRLGEVGKAGTVGGGFRPEQYINDYVANEPGLSALSTSGGQTSPAVSIFDAMRDVAQNFSPKTSRTGLQQTLGASGVVAKGLEGVGSGLEWLSGWKPSQYIGIPTAARAFATALESENMRRAMAKQPQNWANIANTIPTAAAVSGVNAPDRMGYSVTKSP